MSSSGNSIISEDTESASGSGTPPSLSESDNSYRLYGSRWLLLIAVTLLNLANYSHWVAFASVAKQGAEYYHVTGPEVDLIPMISYGLCVPFCLLAVYIVERRGLRFGLMIGSWLTAVGGGLCCLSTLPGLWSEDGSVTAWWSARTAFILTVLGQALTGMGCPFISCVPTKVSQNWFGEGERTMATLILGMSNPLGLVLGQLVTPLIVTQPAQIPLLNLVWFLPALPGFLLTVIGVKSSLPPSPPSPSAAASKTTSRRLFITTILQLARNVPFLIIFMFLGGAMGYISTLQTKLEQILCSRGYSDTIAGVSAALIIISGFVASFPIGYASMKSGKLILISKAACVPAVVVLGVSVWMFLQPFMEELMIVTCVLLGVFSLGIYPVMLELSVEATYPLDESVVTGLCYLSSAIQGSILMFTENLFNSHLQTEEELEIQTCTARHEVTEEGLEIGMEAKNFTNYLIYINVYMIVLILSYFFFFNTELKRSKENDKGKHLKKNLPSLIEDSEILKPLNQIHEIKT